MSLHNLLGKGSLQFVLFGGKGGVGKTTMAAASAVKFARTFPRKKICVFTTDPAPSLGDSFGQVLSSEPQLVKGFGNLWALEIDAKKELAKFKEEYGEEILDIFNQGTYLSEGETEEMFSLDIPGLDEVMGLKKIMDFMATTEYDMYILDTAPTGHTLRLLTLPELLDNWIKFLASLRWRYHILIKSISGKERREKADEFLLEMKKMVVRVQKLLKDPLRTEFVVVTIPEAMGVAETKDLIRQLQNLHMPTRHIIINNITPSSKDSFLQSRRKAQEKYIREIEESFKNFTITKIPLMATEVRGTTSLNELADALYYQKQSVLAGRPCV